VIAVSPSSAEFLRRRYGDHGRLFVVANGLEPAAVATRPAHDGPVRVVSLGSVIEQKGHELLVEAAALRRKGWQATVLGEGPRREALASAARRRGLPVGFPGPSPDIASALAAADIACLPSRWESAPYAALEAMQAGLPLVATDVDGLRDLVQDGVNGLLVTPDSPGALAAALDRVAGDASLRERLGAAARRRAAEFTRARMADETLAVYRAALAWRSSR
jgi:glycosyltransferase involved in cell wall biosynthesis